MKKWTMGLLVLFVSSLSFSQTVKRITLSGYVKDKASGEVLINATISINQLSAAIQSNAYGYFSLSLLPGKYTITVSHTGYAIVQKEIVLANDEKLDFLLNTRSANLEEVVIKGERRIKRTNTVALGVQQVDISQIKRMPAFMGEPDVVKALLTLPGVTSIGEGAAGFNVRGGNVDENLILLDEAPVYNSSHLLGFFSVFNPDAVKNVTLYKSAFPAEYGGRTSSVLDIRMKEGNNENIGVTGGIGNIFSRVAVEGPLQKGKSSFIIAGRRSYIDVLSKPFLKEENRNNTLYFYDLTLKANFKLDRKNTIFLSGYFGRDVLAFNQDVRFNWGNATGSFRWNHLFNAKLFLNTTLYYSKYDYSLNLKSAKEEQRSQTYDWKSNIQTFGVKPTLTWFASSKHQVKAGLNIIFYNFYPGKGILNDNGTKNNITLENRYGCESGIFAEDSWKLSHKWQVQGGVRLSQYSYLGNTTVYSFRDTTPGERKPLESAQYIKGIEPVSKFNFLEPRLSLRYQVNANLHLKLGYSRSSQYVHLISNTASPTPVDLYLPSTKNIKPSYSDQISAGVVSVPSFTSLELSAEIFYKKMYDLVDYIDNASIELNPLIEAELLTGKGKSYGIELEARKDVGKWQGWVNYTYSKSLRKTEGISRNEWYRSRYDRPHVVNASVVYIRNTRWQFSANFNFGSGSTATFPNNRLDIQGLPIPYNSTGKRNDYRLPSYHRLDLAATRKGKQSKKLQQEWVFGLYNVYGRQNAYTIFFRENKDDPSKKEAVRYSVLGSIIPSITWNFKF